MEEFRNAACNKDAIEQAIEQILEEGLFLDWKNEEHLKETPKRVANAYAEIFRGYSDDPKKYFKTFNAVKKGIDNQMVIAGPIKAWSTCIHHMLPFNMDIYIGYIPNKKIIGISKFSRITKSICAKLQIQEQITEEIADFINDNLEPLGMMVIIKNSMHTCSAMRGAKDLCMSITTSAIRGVFKEFEVRKEFLDMIGD